jgi:hypothetical protein
MLSCLCAAAALAATAVAQDAPDVEWSAESKRPVYAYWIAMQSAVNGEELRDSDSAFAEDIATFLEIIEKSQENWGALQGIDLPVFVEDNQALIRFHLERMSYELTLRVDAEGRLDDFRKLTNYVPPEKLSRRSWDELGADTLRAFNMTDLAGLRDAFRRDSGYVRLVSLLSPT